jgi:hypothetical protein
MNRGRVSLTRNSMAFPLVEPAPKQPLDGLANLTAACQHSPGPQRRGPAHEVMRASDSKALAALLRNFSASTLRARPDSTRTGKTKRSFRDAKRNVSLRLA